VFDPYGRLPYAQGMYLATLRGLGEREAALEWVDRCEHESERVGLGFAVGDFRLQRASLLAQSGNLSGAEMELARVGHRAGTGWREIFEAEALAHVSLLRGDSGEAIAAAQRALDIMPPSPWFTIATVEMSSVLFEAGAPGKARAAVERSLALIDERFPGEIGAHDRAWVLASQACLEYRTGEPDLARRSMHEAWKEAGVEAGRLVRAHWPAIKAVLWDALADGTLTAEEVLPALQDAFPGGDALVAMVEHPHPAVRREALLTALSAGHPAVIAELGKLEKDKDEQVAAAAAAARESLRTRPPSLRFELLGGFRVRRAGWELDEAAWQRPMASRVVRFLLIQPEGGVPEDVLFDAFWSDRDADSARQHLAQAVSRARKVLDLPGAEQSVIEAKERTYRLRLRERDSVDADLFVSAAGAALADRSRGRRAALEKAAALWSGEPLPEDRYAPWSFAWRERLTQTYSHVLSALVETYDASGDNHDAIRAATRLLEIDPLNERAHCQLMLAYARTGQKSQALRQFLECRKALVSDLGVEPSAETAALQARILAGDPV
jgi:DNA-binding SARP family transcriptional activator